MECQMNRCIDLAKIKGADFVSEISKLSKRNLTNRVVLIFGL